MLRVRKQVCCVDTFGGRGITAAVLDTGISRHPDFGKRIVGFRDFVGGRVGIYDDDGHGTHVVVSKHNTKMRWLRTSLVRYRTCFYYIIGVLEKQ